MARLALLMRGVSGTTKMKESTLATYLSGGIDAVGLRADLADVVGTDTLRSGENLLSDLSADITIRLDHLVRLCDAYLAGDLDPEHLEAVAFFLIGSNHFTWNTDDCDGAVVAEVLHEWSAPQINFRLTRDTVTRYRAELLKGRPSLYRPANTAPHPTAAADKVSGRG